MKTNRLLSLAILAASLGAVPATAQVPLTPRALGMAGAYTAVARGNETIFLNPANLGLSGNPSWSFAVPQIALSGSMLGPSFGDLGDIQNYDDMDPARRDEILATIPASGTEVRYDLRLPVAAFQNGHFALGVAYGSVGGHTMGKDLVELVFDGYEDGRTDYDVGDTRGSRASFWDFAAAYGRKIGPVSFGVAGHYIHGGSILRSRLAEPRIDLDRRDIEIDYLAVYAKGGRGYGVDVGAAYEPLPSITISGAISNLWSKMEWSEELYTRSLTLNRGDFDAQDAIALWDRYEGSETAVDPNAASLAVYQAVEGLYEEAYFPAIARLGAAWSGSHGTHIGLAYQDQLTTGRLGEGWDRFASAGIQQKIPLLTLRAGAATNLEGGSLLSGGLTLGVIQLGAAKVDHGDLDGTPRSGWIGTFGVGVKTPY